MSDELQEIAKKIEAKLESREYQQKHLIEWFEKLTRFTIFGRKLRPEYKELFGTYVDQRLDHWDMAAGKVGINEYSDTAKAFYYPLKQQMSAVGYKPQGRQKKRVSDLKRTAHIKK